MVYRMMWVIWYVGSSPAKNPPISQTSPSDIAQTDDPQVTGDVQAVLAIRCCLCRDREASLAPWEACHIGALWPSGDRGEHAAMLRLVAYGRLRP